MLPRPLAQPKDAPQRGTRHPRLLLPPETGSQEQQQEADAERRIIQARGEQQVEILKAEGEKRSIELRAEANANATLLQAEADAEANELLKASLSDELLRLKAIEAVQQISTSRNSKLVINPGGVPIWGLTQDLMVTPPQVGNKSQ